MLRRVLLLLSLTWLPLPAAGQDKGAVASVRPLYEMVKDWVVKSAEQMPEEHYSFKPTPEVRSFGQLLGHVANANYLMCSAAKGEANPNSRDHEKASGKPALVEAIKASFAYCDAAYQISDSRAGEEVTLFEGMKGSRLWVLMFNVAHDNEHYGNIVTYLRLKGLVPPSSQGSR